MDQRDGLPEQLQSQSELSETQQLPQVKGAAEVLARNATRVEKKLEPTVYMGLKQLVQDGVIEIPADYRLPPNLRPGPRNSSHNEGREIVLPVIDLAGINNKEQRKQIVTSIREACYHWGFFQVVGHGVPVDLKPRMLNVAREFFDLPAAEKSKFLEKGTDPTFPAFGRTRRTSSGFHSWRDLFKHRSAPISEGDVEKWPTTPESYRETVMEYTQETKRVTDTLLELMAEGLNLEREYFHNALGGREKMTYVIMSAYYPCCPQPDLALGIIGHTDPNPLTIIIQDEPGLEVMEKDGSWIPVTPEPHGYVVNIGDVLQIMTNGKLASCEHRVLADANHERISVMLFAQPDYNGRIGVEPEFLTEEEPEPRYRNTTWAKFLNAYGLEGLDRKVTDLVSRK